MSKMAGALKTLRHVYERIRGQGIKETFVKARDQGFINSLLDGNLFETKVLKGEGKLVGEDKLGNKVRSLCFDCCNILAASSRTLKVRVCCHLLACRTWRTQLIMLLGSGASGSPSVTNYTIDSLYLQ